LWMPERHRPGEPTERRSARHRDRGSVDRLERLSRATDPERRGRSHEHRPGARLGGSFVRGDPSAAVQIANSTINYTGANAFVEVDLAGTTAHLAGSLASIGDSTINGNGALFTLSNGAQLTRGPAPQPNGGLLAGAGLSEA